jgi:hypothetical protein
MTVLVGVMGATSISIAQGPQPVQSGRILFATFEGLYVTDASGLQSKQLLKGPPWAAALSPHGDLVAYADERAVRVVSLLNGQSLTLASLRGERVDTVAWSPNQRACVAPSLGMSAWGISSRPMETALYNSLSTTAQTLVLFARVLSGHAVVMAARAGCPVRQEAPVRARGGSGGVYWLTVSGAARLSGGSQKKKRPRG